MDGLRGFSLSFDPGLGLLDSPFWLGAAGSEEPDGAGAEAASVVRVDPWSAESDFDAVMGVGALLLSGKGGVVTAGASGLGLVRLSWVLAGEYVAVPVFSTSSGGEGGTGVFGRRPVVCLMNVAMARKQYLAGVVNANSIGRVCAQSRELNQRMN